MGLSKRWNGSVFGTNTGKVAIALEGVDSDLSGTMRFADNVFGPAVFNIRGKFDDGNVEFTGEKCGAQDEAAYGTISLKGRLKSDGSIAGDWQSTTGTGGTYFLFPHDIESPNPTAARLADQMHTKIHNFGPIVIEKTSIVALAETVQRELPGCRVVITFTTSTEQSRYLEDFKQHAFTNDRVEFLKIQCREPDGTGIDRMLAIEFGQNINFVTAQGSQESWVLGTAEKLKHTVASMQRSHPGKNFGIVINQLIVFSAIAAVPSLESYWQRLIFLLAVLGFTFGANWLHTKVLPNAVIYVGDRKEDRIQSIALTSASWLINLVAGVLSALIAAYFNGMLHLPSQ